MILQGKRKKYLIALFIDEYDIDGLIQDFSVEYETTDLGKANQKLDTLVKSRVELELKKRNESDRGYYEWSIMDMPADKRPLFVSVNRYNKVLRHEQIGIENGSGYDKAYYYYDIIEVPVEAKVDERLFNRGFCEREVERFFEPFVAFILDRKKLTYAAYLVNPSGVDYSRITEIRRGFTSEEDELLHIRRVVKEEDIGLLPPHSYRLLEKGLWDKLGNPPSHEINFYDQENKRNPSTRIYYLPPNGSEYTLSKLRVLNKEGMKLEFRYSPKSDPVIYGATYLRGVRDGKITEIFNNSKREVFNAVKSAAKETDSMIQKIDFEKGEILIEPDRMMSVGKTVKYLAEYKPWLWFAPRMAVYFFINERPHDTELEIVHVYANTLDSKQAQKYQTALAQHIKECLNR